MKHPDHTAEAVSKIDRILSDEEGLIGGEVGSRVSTDLAMTPRSRHTDPEAEGVQLSLLRNASNARRGSLALALSGWALQMAQRAIRRAHPELSEREVGLRFVELHYGEDLAERVRRHLAERES